ncbi:hypothetical protein OG612_29500 [Streptomyces sp. NBC_01527]|uniref:hypothetical protein n=1 Tax=Streptomyces sp. NBC_01527 TaxID=2903894 RepID=UPI0038694114
MTPPLLSTRHPWQLRFGETPLPPTLPPDIDIVRVGMGLGMAAIDAMIDSAHRVGPLLCCITHRMLLVPVASGTADLWGAAHSVCSTGSTLHCVMHGYQSICHNRLWVTPPESLAYPTTDPGMFHDRLSLMRARMRTAARQPLSVRTREVCHV